MKIKVTRGASLHQNSENMSGSMSEKQSRNFSEKVSEEREIVYRVSFSNSLLLNTEKATKKASILKLNTFKFIKIILLFKYMKKFLKNLPHYGLLAVKIKF